jgi:hypothetical protein
MSLFRHSRSLRYVAVAAALLAAGCATTTDSGGEAAPVRPSFDSFVTQPGRLQPMAGRDDALHWEEAGVNLGSFKAIAMERIRVSLAGDAKQEAVDPADLNLLTDYFHAAIAKALGADYPLVDEAGPGVLQMRVVIFDLYPTSVTTSVAVFFTPYAMVPDIAAGSTTKGGAGASPYLGRTGIAVQFMDGASGKVIGEYVETKFGKKYVVDTSQGAVAAVSTGVSSYAKAFSAWDYAKQAFDTWAQQLRGRLDADRARLRP